MDEGERPSVSRRDALAFVGMSAAMAGANSVLAQNDSTSANTTGTTMQDPRSKYPQPPFRKQTQPWPGLARDMDPKPDHGETTYEPPRLPMPAKARTLRSTTILRRSPMLARSFG